MCLIIKKPAGIEIDPAFIAEAQNYSKDGFGVIIYTDEGVRVLKALKQHRLFTLLKHFSKYEMIIHLRKATAGEKSVANLHPYLVPYTGILLMHNGTMNFWATGTDSDTRIFAGMIAPTLQADRELMFDFATQRLWQNAIGKGTVLLCHPDGRTVTIGDNRNWLEHEGLLLSNSYAWGSWYQREDI